MDVGGKMARVEESVLAAGILGDWYAEHMEGEKRVERRKQKEYEEMCSMM